jgi:hypothetical protein
MRILGADFSGAKASNIALASGVLQGRRLTVEHLYACDDRLDLYYLLASTFDAPFLCGLDFPFRLSAVAAARLEGAALHELALTHDRRTFAAILERRIGVYEGKCASASIYCRETDAACGAYSGMKRVNPSLVSMLYAGSKLLFYLCSSGVAPYPLSAPSPRQVCEVYPSHTWAKVGMKRSTNVRAFVDSFNALGIIHVELPARYDVAATQDIADSIVACVTTAAVQARDDIFHNWSQRPSFITDAEWAAAGVEGLIVRI